MSVNPVHDNIIYRKGRVQDSGSGDPAFESCLVQGEHCIHTGMEPRKQLWSVIYLN